MRMGSYYRANLLEFLGLSESQGTILDIGGHDGFVLSQLRAANKVSLDIEPSPAHPGIQYCRGDGLCLAFKDESFDAVYAIDVLEHVENERQLVSELLRVLKPNGRLVLTTPQEDIRIIPSFLMSWTNRRWGHDRVPGYEEDFVRSILAAHTPRSVEVSKLASSWFLKLFLPLSLVWRVVPAIGRKLIETAARFDAAGRGPRGYLLAEVWK